MVKSLPCNAGYVRSNVGQGTKIPHAIEHPSPQGRAAEPVHHNWRVHGLQGEGPI